MNILIIFCKVTDSIYAGVVGLCYTAAMRYLHFFKTKYRKKQRQIFLPLVVQERRVSTFPFGTLV
jgi:hypothetical protein